MLLAKFLYPSLAVILLIQQWVILRPESNEQQHWPGIAGRYRRHMRWTIFLGVLVLTACCVWAAANQDFAQEFAEALRSNSTHWVAFVMAFAVGALRLALERSADEPAGIAKTISATIRAFLKPGLRPVVMRVRDGTAGIDRDADPRAWLYVFAMSLAVTLVYPALKDLFVPSTNGDPISGAVAYPVPQVVLANILFFLAWFSWVYIGLFGKLVRYHEFSGNTARQFLGRTLVERDIPCQAVVIGPKRAGKTAFSLGRACKENELDTKCLMSVLFRAQPEENEAQAGGNVFLANIIDTPGENMGDHLLMISHYRCDTLVLVLNESQFDMARLAEGGVTFQRMGDFMRKEGNDAGPAFYMRALYSAILRTEQQVEDVRLQDPYKVKSFVLFINRSNPQHSAVASLLYGNGVLQSVAEDIGRHFGVPTEFCVGISGVACRECSGACCVVE